MKVQAMERQPSVPISISLVRDENELAIKVKDSLHELVLNSPALV